jgi:hypothetical protein
MGAAFLRTMNMPELVARSRSEYVRIAVRLWEDKTFHNDVVRKIKERLHIVWEDMEYAFSWSQLLSKSVGLTPLSWDEYILQTGRNLDIESTLRDQRIENRRLFDLEWGREAWLLENNIASLLSHLNSSQVGRAFIDWAVSEVSPTEIKVENGKRSTEIETKSRSFVSEEINIDINRGDGKEYRLEELRKLARGGKFDESYAIAMSLLSEGGRYQKDPQFLLDLGILQYYRGEFQSAFDYCREVEFYTPKTMIVAECIGVAGLYIKGKEVDALKALIFAWQQQKSEKEGERATQSILKSSVFEFTEQSVEYNLLNGLMSGGFHKDCVDVTTQIMDLPILERGGKFNH